MIGPSTMTSGVYRAALLYVWAGLTAATVLSFWLGTDHGISSAAVRNIVLLIVAFIKVRFVGLYFMELKSAPWALRGLFELYCVAVCLTLVNLYLFS